MIIDGTNISSFGLVLLKADDGFFGLPKRKEILSDPAFETNDIKHKSLTGMIYLLGQWSTAEQLEIGLGNFQTLIKSQVQHNVELDEYNLPAFGGAVFSDGYTVEVFATVAKITAKIIVSNSKWIAN